MTQNRTQTKAFFVFGDDGLFYALLQNERTTCCCYITMYNGSYIVYRIASLNLRMFIELGAIKEKVAGMAPNVRGMQLRRTGSPHVPMVVSYRTARLPSPLRYYATTPLVHNTMELEN